MTNSGQIASICSGPEFIHLIKGNGFILNQNWTWLTTESITGMAMASIMSLKARIPDTTHEQDTRVKVQGCY